MLLLVCFGDVHHYYSIPQGTPIFIIVFILLYIKNRQEKCVCLDGRRVSSSNQVGWSAKICYWSVHCVFLQITKV